MSEEPQKKILELAAALLEEAPAERVRRLAEVPLDLARAVESLIAAAEEAEIEGFLSAPSPDPASADAELSSLLPRGTTVGRFLILEAIGAGGMGVVYAAYDPQLERKVAVKLLRPDRSSGSKTRLLREAQALARLAHPNVVSVFEVGAFGEQIFVAMEFVEGRSLRIWLRDEKPPWPSVVSTFVEAARGLQAAHDAGLVHRDFKPDNVLIGHDGRVRVVDFGLARAVGTDEFVDPQGASSPSSPASGRLLATRLTREGAVIGTPGFVAPEVLAGAVADARSDQFGFAVALRQALAAGIEPDDGPGTPPLKAPRSVALALARGLEPEPARRFASMNEFVEALLQNPGARRRRFAIAALALVAALALGLVAARWRGSGTLCRGQDRRLASVWDDAVQSRVQAAFSRTRVPYATAAWTGFERTMNQRAAAWKTMHREACEATQVLGEQSPELLDLRMACLDQRLQEMGALASVFATADAAVVERGVEAANGLPDLSRCADRALLRAVGKPSDPAVAGKAEALSAVAARARALNAAGRYAAALELVDPALAEAVALGHAPTEALLRFERAVALFRRDDLAAAELEFQLTSTAAERGSDDRLALAGLVERALLLGAYLGRVDDGVRVADLAAAKLVRIGGDATAEAALLTARAYLHLNRGEVAPAIADAERALALRRQTEGGDSPGIARALANLGDLVAWGGDLRRALELQQEASAMVEHSLGSAHPMFAGMLHSVAVSERETGRYTEALAHFDREIALLRETLGDAHGSTATALMNRAMTWFEIDRFAEAETDVRSSLAAFGGASEDADSVYGQSLLAAIQRSRGQWEESLLSATRALEAGQRLWGRDHYFLVQFLSERGLCFLGLRRFDDAWADVERGRALARGAAEIPRFEVSKLGFVGAQAEAGRGDLARALRTANAALDGLGPEPPGARGTKLEAALRAWIAQRQSAEGRFRG